ncbi:hypothetical protein [Rufibacter hautae]|uniref:Uncharacterized protein n=1 Tax=Rufibacter hautae TaxID=2595005 RepID=A0A5B6TAG9_9BACT|nr:hypothetical protein [Rufibacter hautae]KAA3435951.1 hypothetical protein FOA19_23185 [Rufibacter hautae]
MSIDFFDSVCQDNTDAGLFGLRDDDDKTRAYVDLSAANSSRWIAIVENEKGIEVTFTAIDNCIEILRPDGTMESRCDGMLTYPDNIVFVELKEVRSGGWITEGTNQLKTSIGIFGENYDLGSIRKRRAFLANRISPKFQYGQQELMDRFRDETGVRLIIHNQIKL